MAIHVLFVWWQWMACCRSCTTLLPCRAPTRAQVHSFHFLENDKKTHQKVTCLHFWASRSSSWSFPSMISSVQVSLRIGPCKRWKKGLKSAEKNVAHHWKSWTKNLWFFVQLFQWCAAFFFSRFQHLLDTRWTTWCLCWSWIHSSNPCYPVHLARLNLQREQSIGEISPCWWIHPVCFHRRDCRRARWSISSWEFCDIIWPAFLPERIRVQVSQDPTRVINRHFSFLILKIIDFS